MMTEEKTMGSNWKIAMPKDADGREIPLNTTALYDKEGNELCVKRIEFDPFNGLWRFAVRKCSPDLANIYCSPQDVHLEKPVPSDSWEKLLEDLETCDICEYFGYSKRASKDDYGCNNCKVYKISGNRLDDSDCFKKMIIDLASRIRKLMGENE